MRRALHVLTLVAAAAALSGAGPRGKRPRPEPAADVPEKPEPKPVLTPETAARPAFHADTRCEACHSTTSWSDVRFAHDKTGFALHGEHQRVSCKACHPVDFKMKVPRGCVGCHRDAHGGDLGARCEGCHDEESWRSRFTADAHRKSAFPLVGRHAVLPCEECHGDARDRGFTRPTVPCVGCHQREYDATSASAFDHGRAGFSTECRQCHVATTFARALFPSHDACFRISSGSHARIACLGCHTTLSAFAAPGGCNTGSAACTACHDHACARTDSQHAGVPGYQCRDRKCYECHRFTGGSP